MDTIIARLEEVSQLLALIELTPGPYAHLAHRQAAIATHALESELVSKETVSASELVSLESAGESRGEETPNSLKILRTIAETKTAITFDAAIMSGNASLVWLTVESGAIITKNGFMYACKHGFVDIVRLLLDLPPERGINPAAGDNAAFRNACAHGRADIVRLLLDLPPERGINPAAGDNAAFRNACAHGRADIVRLLLDLPQERGVDPTADNHNAFSLACCGGYLEIARLLLDLPVGIDPSAKNFKAFRGACMNGWIEIIRLLIDVDRGTDTLVIQDILDKRLYANSQRTVICDILEAKLLLTTGDPVEVE